MPAWTSNQCAQRSRRTRGSYSAQELETWHEPLRRHAGGCGLEDRDVPALQTVPVEVPVVDATGQPDSKRVLAREGAHGLICGEDLERPAEGRGRRAVDEARYLSSVLPMEIREPWRYALIELSACHGDSRQIEPGHHAVDGYATWKCGVAAVVLILQLTRERIFLRVAHQLEAERRLGRGVENRRNPSTPPRRLAAGCEECNQTDQGHSEKLSPHHTFLRRCRLLVWRGVDCGAGFMKPTRASPYAQSLRLARTPLFPA